MHIVHSDTEKSEHTLEHVFAKSQPVNQGEENEVEYISEAEILNEICEGLTDIRLRKKGKIKPKSVIRPLNGSFS